MKVFKGVLVALLVIALAAFAAVMVLPVDSIVAKVSSTISGHDASEDYEDTLYRYYYNKLETENEKLAYRIICESVVDFEKTITIPEISSEELATVYQAILYDNPEFFFLGNQCTISSFGSVYTFVPQYLISESDYDSYNYEVKKAVKDVLGLIDDSWSDYDKELFIHDYIAENCTYATSGDGMIYTIYGALVEKSANCEGYSKTAQWLLKECGIENHLAVGNASLNGEAASNDNAHMWNVVKINDKWYNLDVTWDDTMITDESTGTSSDTLLDNRASHVYFNISTADIKASHTVTDETIWSDCTNDSFAYFKYNGLEFSTVNSATYSQMAQKIAAAVNDGYSSIEFRFTSQSAYEQAYSRLAVKGEIYYAYKEANSFITGSDRINTQSIVTTDNSDAYVIRFFFEKK